MGRADDTEVATVESGDCGLIEALRQSDKACVGSAEWEIGVLGDEVSDPVEIVGRQILNDEVASGDGLEEACFGLRTYPTSDQVRGFGNDEWRCMEWFR